MKIQYNTNELIDKIVVFYNADTLDILNIFKPYSFSFNVNEFIKNIHCENIGFFINDCKEYDNYCANINMNYHYYIDVENQKLCFEIHKIENYDNNKSLFYGCQNVKREYSKEQISDMYNNDYINFNLKNIINSKIFDVRFVRLKDLKLRNRIVEKRWDTFCSDPFLQNMSEDKIKLGLDILEKGTYYPLIVSQLNPTDTNLYIFEGNHRAISLKLLQQMGKISEDFKMLCIIIPCNYMQYKTTNKKTQLENPILLRGILENIYGSVVINNKDILNQTINKINNEGSRLVNDYTIEYYGYTVDDVIFTIHSYPLWVRDLIFDYKNEILPNDIINKEEIFNKWNEG